VPRTRLPEALTKVSEISNKYNFPHGNVFHAGDGNLHPLIFFHSRDKNQLHKVKKAGWEIMEACVALGGTISGEHGIGVEKMEAMRLIYTENDLVIQRVLKKAFDPENLLNPGKVIPEPIASDPLIREVRENEQEIIEIIKDAISNGRSVHPVGHGNRADRGRDVIEIDSRSFETINEYDSGGQVIAAGAGMTFMNLQKKLGANNQWLPIRPPFSYNSITVGGLTATGAAGPERVTYGAPRDRLLGLRFISGEGRLIRAGGRVMKNVSGYDMTRLIAGSGGTLGFITEATFRVAILPDQCVALSAIGSLEACHATSVTLNQSNLQPVFTATIQNNQAGPGTKFGEWKLYIGFEGFSKSIEYQVNKAKKILTPGGLKPADSFEYEATRGVFQKYFKALDGSLFIFRADFPVNRLLEFANGLAEQVEGVGIFVDSGCGRITAGTDALDKGTWNRICCLAAGCGGHVLLEKMPEEFKKNLNPFGPLRTELKISRKIKAMLDPHNIFVSDRLLG